MLVIVQDRQDNVIRRYEGDHVPRVGDGITLFDGAFEQKLFWSVAEVDWQLRIPEGPAIVLVIVEPKTGI